MESPDFFVVGKDTVSRVRLDNPNSDDRRNRHPKDGSTNKSSLELQKVLILIVSRLRERPRPPTIFEQIALDASKKTITKVDAMVETIKGAIRLGGSTDQTPSPDDEEDEAIPGFSTAATLDMMIQLRDILVVAHRQGWEILPSRSVVHSL